MHDLVWLNCMTELSVSPSFNKIHCLHDIHWLSMSLFLVMSFCHLKYSSHEYHFYSCNSSSVSCYVAQFCTDDIVFAARLFWTMIFLNLFKCLFCRFCSSGNICSITSFVLWHLCLASTWLLMRQSFPSRWILACLNCRFPMQIFLCYSLIKMDHCCLVQR